MPYSRVMELRLLDSECHRLLYPLMVRIRDEEHLPSWASQHLGLRKLRNIDEHLDTIYFDELGPEGTWAIKPKSNGRLRRGIR